MEYGIELDWKYRWLRSLEIQEEWFSKHEHSIYQSVDNHQLETLFQVDEFMYLLTIVCIFDNITRIVKDLLLQILRSGGSCFQEPLRIVTWPL